MLRGGESERRVKVKVKVRGKRAIEGYFLVMGKSQSMCLAKQLPDDMRAVGGVCALHIAGEGCLRKREMEM